MTAQLGKANDIDLSTETTFEGTKFYKVLFVGISDYRRLTGGYTHMDWRPYLPTQNGPGKPCVLDTSRDLRLCHYGLHVTNAPWYWGLVSTDRLLTNERRLFEAKVFGPVMSDMNYDMKICAYKVQLVREIPFDTDTNSEWNKLARGEKV